MATYLTYRWQVAGETGAFFQSTATSGTTTTLVDATYLASSTISEDFYDDWYLFRPDAVNTRDMLKRVASYDPANGTLTPDSAYVVAPAAIERYELHGLIEPLTQMRLIVNEGLKRCYLTRETTLTPTALAQRHSLAAVTWVDEPWKVRSVGFLSSGESRTQVNPYARVVRGSVSNEAGTFYLNHPGYTFNSTDTLYLLTVASGYSLGALTGGSLTGTGIGGDTDTAPIGVAWLAQAALVEAYRRLAGTLDPIGNQRLEQNRLEAAASFTTLRRQNFQLPPLTFEPLVALGPLPSYAGWA